MKKVVKQWFMGEFKGAPECTMLKTFPSSSLLLDCFLELATLVKTPRPTELSPLRKHDDREKSPGSEWASVNNLRADGISHPHL